MSSRQRNWRFSVIACMWLPLFASCQSRANSVKFIHESSLRFEVDKSYLTSSHMNQLQTLADMASEKCLPRNAGSRGVAIDGIFAESTEQKSAEDRALNVKAQLMRLGWIENDIYMGTTSLIDMVKRKSAPTSLPKVVIEKDSVFLEMFCDPR